MTSPLSVVGSCFRLPAMLNRWCVRGIIARKLETGPPIRGGALVLNKFLAHPRRHAASPRTAAADPDARATTPGDLLALALLTAATAGTPRRWRSPRRLSAGERTPLATSYDAGCGVRAAAAEARACGILVTSIASSGWRRFRTRPWSPIGAVSSTTVGARLRGRIVLRKAALEREVHALRRSA